MRSASDQWETETVLSAAEVEQAHEHGCYYCVMDAAVALVFPGYIMNDHCRVIIAISDAA